MHSPGCAVDRSRRRALRRSLTDAQRAELGAFEREYFDGPTGYGGYYYDGRHAPAVGEMIARYGLTERSAVLDVGCAKGFMLTEFVRLGVANVAGCDVSAYALEQAHPEIRVRLRRLSADDLAYPADSFDLVYSVDVVHNLAPEACDRAIREIMRVSRGSCFVQVASFETAEQERALREWGVTVRTFRSKEKWRTAFDRLNYSGEYSFKTF